MMKRRKLLWGNMQTMKVKRSGRLLKIIQEVTLGINSKRN
jgi:hypothetical protein